MGYCSRRCASPLFCDSCFKSGPQPLPLLRSQFVGCSAEPRRGHIMALRIDFTSEDYLRHPAARVERLRASGPVVEVRLPIIGWTWVTTTQVLADQVLKDSETFTLRNDGGAVVPTKNAIRGRFSATRKSVA